jgi:hypothetical protein
MSMIWMRLPPVSSRTAAMTGPMAVDGWVEVTLRR